MYAVVQCQASAGLAKIITTQGELEVCELLGKPSMLHWVACDISTSTMNLSKGRDQ